MTALSDNRSWLLALVLACSGLSALAQDAAGADVVYPPFRETYPADGIELGRGWFQHRGIAAASSCVKGEPKPLGLSDVTYSFEEQTSREQAFKSLNVGAAARYGAFSATASFAQSSTADRSRLNVLAVVRARKGGDYLGPGKDGRVTMDADRLAPLKKVAERKDNENERIEALRAFFLACGDAYVSAIEKGGLYVSRFERAAESSVRETLYGATAKGGFGRFKLALSMSKTTRDTLARDETRIATMQQGGDLALPVSAADAYDRISQFATRVTAENSAPQALVLRAYESHPDFPKGYETLRTPGERINQIAGLADRFGALSEDYLRAYFTRWAYQFPFQQIDSAACVQPEGGAVTSEHCMLRELYEESVSAGLMADCLEQVVQWCRRDAVCNVNRLPQDAKAIACLDDARLRQLLDPQIFTAKRIAGGASDDPDEVRTVRQRLIDRIRGAFVPAGGGTPGQASKGALNLPRAASQYLAAVARLPLAVDGSTDELGDALKYCNLISGAPCKADDLPNRSEADLLPVRTGLREWVFAERLGRIVQDACRLDTDHPLCVSGDQVQGIANGLLPQFKAPRRFPAAAIKVPAVVIPPPPPPERCGSSGGGGYKGNLRAGGGCY